MTARNVNETHGKSLRDPEVAAEYLKDALESRDKAVMQLALCNIADAYNVEIGQSTIGQDEASKAALDELAKQAQELGLD
jgi:DNA-binding phage protein